MTQSRIAQPRQAIGYKDRNLPWARMWSRRAEAIYITASTSAIARWCITQGSRARGAEDQWKRFLSLVSPAADPCG